MEDVEVSIFDPNAIEIRGGECSSVKRGGVLAVTFASYSYKVSVFPNTPVRNILGGLRLSFLIEEDDGVEVRLSPVVSYPSFSRVFWILKIASEGGGEPDRLRRGSGPSNGGVVLGETNGFVRVDAVLTHVWVNEVKDTRDEEKVLYRFEVAVGGLESFVVKSVIAQYIDGSHKILRPS